MMTILAEGAVEISTLAKVLPIVVIGIYLAVVLYIGIFAFRRGKTTGEDFFLASRSIGPIVFFLSLFATNMTSVAILGSSGLAYKQGIGIFGMMATISALIIPLSLFVIGTRLWAIGKKHGHMTQVAFFRDRWECSTIGTVVFALSAVMLLPYLIVSIIGGGTILETLSHNVIPFWLGGAIVALVVMGNVFFGGLRGAVWVNVFQTLLFLAFGGIALLVIGSGLKGGFSTTVHEIISSPRMSFLMTREEGRISQFTFLSYCFIPLSSIMFPHMAIMCFTAKKVTAFKKTVILYPLCIMAIWLPCVFLGGIGGSQPEIGTKIVATSEEIRPWLIDPKSGAEPKLILAMKYATVPGAKALAEKAEAGISPEEFAAELLPIRQKMDKVLDAQALAAKTQPAASVAATGSQPANPNAAFGAEYGRLAAANSDSVLLHLLDKYAPAWLAGLLAAGIISAVMGSDCHQILALSTMFSKDIFEYYGGRKKVGEKATVFFGRAFIVVANSIAYIIALGKPAIFETAVKYAFSGFASLAPVMVAALFWKRSTKYGALASALWVALCLSLQRLAEMNFGKDTTIWQLGDVKVLAMNKIGNLSIAGFMPVVPMVLGSCVCVVIGSLLTKPPSRATIEKYFDTSTTKEPTGRPVETAA